MENRRNNYRHLFEKETAISVELYSPSTPEIRLRGVMTNLSITGMAVNFPSASVVLKPEERFRAQFSLPNETDPILLDCEVVHPEADPKPREHGFRFLPLLNHREEESRQRKLWLFLLDEQRRAIQARRNADQ